ncbi:uncharacterized protein LOC108203136 [Daucus carota subsp. sativus]|nr:PREDICTED: uncharacterized protein LOC108203136 [Daucus carota subsp. sativus]
MFHWKKFDVVLPFVLFLFWLIYHLSCRKTRYYISVSTVITYFMRKIKALAIKIWSQFRRNPTECLGVLFQLEIAALTSLLPTEPHLWTVRLIESIAIFAILSYCFKVFVEMKRAQLTPTLHYVNTRNNERVCFFTITHGLEFLLPLLYLLLAYAYFKELHLENHHMKNDWKMAASAIKMFIDILSGLLAVMGACKVYYWTRNEQNQLLPVSMTHNIPRNWNERILASGVLPRDAQYQNVANFSDAVVQRHAENQSVAGATASVRDSENQPNADPPEVIQRDDAENQTQAHADVPEAAVQEC